jgi:hypothetical protein
MLLQWVKDQGINLDNKVVLFVPIAKRGKNRGQYHIDVEIETQEIDYTKTKEVKAEAELEETKEEKTVGDILDDDPTETLF